MKHLAILILLVLFSVFNGYCQVESICATIDFEEINGVLPKEDFIIDDQFFAQYGLKISREDGGFPVIAKVGGIGAFSSAWGNNLPAPGVNIGDYFLTDDGMLSGPLGPPPLLLEFSAPIDSISGCYLDIDFDEQFFIQALDIEGNVIKENIILAGDPGTGDGALSCWGLNLTSSEEKIYSVRLEGFRQAPGALGVGVDNITVCSPTIISNSVNSLNSSTVILSPNPVSTILTLDQLPLGYLAINLYSLYGKQVLKTTVVNTQTTTLDVSHLEQGIYLLQLQNEKSQNLLKVIVE